MRSFSLLILLLVVLIAGYSMLKNVRGTGYTATGTVKTDDLENRLNDSINKYQDSLQKRLQQSGAGASGSGASGSGASGSGASGSGASGSGASGSGPSESGTNGSE
jgi:hypothetical protein